MKIALVTTTINVPKVLGAYRRTGPRVEIYVAGDQKTPHAEAHTFCDKIGAHYLHPEHHQHWKHVAMLGQNTDSLRNVAVLRALQDGAEILISVDDDMIPGTDFFWNIERIFEEPFSGVCLGRGDSISWLDVGTLTTPMARQRGLTTNAGIPNTHEFVTDVQVGALQGIILGTPDTDASTTIVNRPLVHSASDILKSGFVVDPQTKCVFNSQITSFRRELAPAFGQFYKWERRNTDILAAVIMRRIMRDRGLYTYYGPPTAYHARAPRDPQLDMNAEQWGLNKISALQDYLDNTDVWKNIQVEATCAQRLRGLYEDMLTFDMFPREDVEARLAWLEDCSSVL